MELGRRQSSIRWAGVVFGVLLVAVAMVGGVGAVEPGSGGQQQSAGETAKQVQAVLGQVWELVGPWVQWAKSIGRDLFAVVYERASLQGLKSVAAEAGRIGFDFFSGRPYQAAYEVARDVPGVGRAVKEVVGEANLRKKAAREKAEEKEL
ncbi:hypothetical protein M758_10G055400 [Ceratodon purpureus]|uniref:Uncharacterized protein n=1 Tax=Ceratodon purpureus TaxID=3225 RepID=A0A8T0GKU8_CERPU|nr:hypothetical protein KC19_10G059100 [Ceratodon purpureus]KAG0602973.1 hypothetical protein M758_10G055400 [Ceratodon purpureus]